MSFALGGLGCHDANSIYVLKMGEKGKYKVAVWMIFCSQLIQMTSPNSNREGERHMVVNTKRQPIQHCLSMESM